MNRRCHLLPALAWLAGSAALGLPGISFCADRGMAESADRSLLLVRGERLAVWRETARLLASSQALSIADRFFLEQGLELQNASAEQGQVLQPLLKEEFHRRRLGRGDCPLLLAAGRALLRGDQQAMLLRSLERGRSWSEECHQEKELLVGTALYFSGRGQAAAGRLSELYFDPADERELADWQRTFLGLSQLQQGAAAAAGKTLQEVTPESVFYPLALDGQVRATAGLSRPSADLLYRLDFRLIDEKELPARRLIQLQQLPWLAERGPGEELWPALSALDLRLRQQRADGRRLLADLQGREERLFDAFDPQADTAPALSSYWVQRLGRDPELQERWSWDRELGWILEIAETLKRELQEIATSPEGVLLPKIVAGQERLLQEAAVPLAPAPALTRLWQQRQRLAQGQREIQGLRALAGRWQRQLLANRAERHSQRRFLLEALLGRVQRLDRDLSQQTRILSRENAELAQAQLRWRRNQLQTSLESAAANGGIEEQARLKQLQSELQVWDRQNGLQLQRWRVEAASLRGQLVSWEERARAERQRLRWESRGAIRSRLQQLLAWEDQMQRQLNRHHLVYLRQLQGGTKLSGPAAPGAEAARLRVKNLSFEEGHAGDAAAAYYQLLHLFTVYQEENSRPPQKETPGRPLTAAERQTLFSQTVASAREMLQAPSAGQRRDLLYFVLGLSHLERGEIAKAIAAWEALLAEAPRSPLAAAAAFWAGELSLSRKELPAAERFYLAVLSHGFQEYYGRALYRLAWLYSGAQVERSRAYFMIYLDYRSRYAGPAEREGDADLGEQSLDALAALVMTHGGLTRAFNLRNLMPDKDFIEPLLQRCQNWTDEKRSRYDQLAQLAALASAAEKRSFLPKPILHGQYLGYLQRLLNEKIPHLSSPPYPLAARYFLLSAAF